MPDDASGGGEAGVAAGHRQTTRIRAVTLGTWNVVRPGRVSWLGIARTSSARAARASGRRWTTTEEQRASAQSPSYPVLSLHCLDPSLTLIREVLTLTFRARHRVPKFRQMGPR